MNKASLLLLSLLLVGCSGGSTTHQDAQSPGDLQVTQDSTQSDTVAVQPTLKCSDENPCAQGELCDCHGLCVPDPQSATCEEDKNCGLGSVFCDPCLNRCFDKADMCAPCTIDNGCKGTGSRCLLFQDGNQYCGRACEGDAGCTDSSHPNPIGFTCAAVDGLTTTHCLPLSGSCDTPALCSGNSDCAVGQYCNDLTGQCADGCADDLECPGGTVCSALQCQAPCDDASNPCDDGFLCDDTGHCKPDGGCFTAADCPLPETYCDDATQTCKDGCLTDFDCKSSKKVCEAGACVDRPCPGNFWCAFGQECSPETGQCAKADGPFCEVCDPQGDHDAQCGAGGKCLSLQDDDGNDLGAFCGPACGSDPANACPKGYSCVDLEDDQGQPMGSICFRDCSYDPVGN